MQLKLCDISPETWEDIYHDRTKWQSVTLNAAIKAVDTVRSQHEEEEEPIILCQSDCHPLHTPVNVTCLSEDTIMVALNAYLLDACIYNTNEESAGYTIYTYLHTHVRIEDTHIIGCQSPC